MGRLCKIGETAIGSIFPGDIISTSLNCLLIELFVASSTLEIIIPFIDSPGWPQKFSFELDLHELSSDPVDLIGIQ